MEGKRVLIDLIGQEIGSIVWPAASNQIYLREHFEHEVSGTTLQDVILNIEELAAIDHPQAQDIVLQSLEFEDNGD